jgi:polyhydroxyalkanoate synthase subunit PhaC
MIVSRKVVEQAIDRDDVSRFVKELIVTDGPITLSMVRKRAADARGEPKATRGAVLLLHGYGQNRYAWHLPSRSMSCFLAREGYDVFNLDLRGHGRSAHLGSPRPLTSADYVREDVPSALATIEKLTGPQPVFLIGHSLGGLVGYAVAGAMPERIAGVASIGSPYHFLRGARGLRFVGALGERAVAAMTRLQGDSALELKWVGEAMRSMRLIVESPLYPLPIRGYCPANIEREVVGQHMAFAMDIGSIRVIRSMFQSALEREKNNDPSGGIDGFGDSFEQRKDLPLLVIAGTVDDLAPPPSVASAFERSQSGDKTYRTFPFGHLDLLVGREAPYTVWASILAWLRKRDQVGTRDRLRHAAE